METFNSVDELCVTDEYYNDTKLEVLVNSEYMSLSYRTTELVILDVETARQVRDWLNNALPIGENDG